MNNIVLIGMPAAGKSTVGVIVAKILGYQFIDSDLIIQEREQRLLKDIIAEDGLDGFIAIENDVNSKINERKTVIATGGSVIYGEEAMKHLASIGCIVYIKLSAKALERRLGNIKKRGVALRDNQTFEELYKERCPLYEKYAHVTIDSENMETEDLVEAIIHGVKR